MKMVFAVRTCAGNGNLCFAWAVTTKLERATRSVNSRTNRFPRVIGPPCGDTQSIGDHNLYVQHSVGGRCPIMQTQSSECRQNWCSSGSGSSNCAKQRKSARKHWLTNAA